MVPKAILKTQATTAPIAGAVFSRLETVFNGLGAVFRIVKSAFSFLALASGLPVAALSSAFYLFTLLPFYLSMLGAIFRNAGATTPRTGGTFSAAKLVFLTDISKEKKEKTTPPFIFSGNYACICLFFPIFVEHRGFRHAPYRHADTLHHGHSPHGQPAGC